jgi:NACHT N-terminal Helical domain 7
LLPASGVSCDQVPGASWPTDPLWRGLIVSKGLTYVDAVKLLGGSGSKVVAAIDKLAGGILLAASPGTAGITLGLFEAKNEFIRLSMDLISSLSDKLNGLSRFSRSERLAAAQAVLILVAFFEAQEYFENNAVDDGELPQTVRDMMLRFARGRKTVRSEQANLMTSAALHSDRMGAIAQSLLNSDLPSPTPQTPYEITLGNIRGLYGTVSAQMPVCVFGQDAWDAFHEDDQKIFLRSFQSRVISFAIERYEELFRRLAAEFPELAFWANLVDHQATRSEVRELRAGLEGLERVLESIASGRPADERRDALARFYQAALRRQIIETAEVPADGLKIPTLGDAYVNPRFRVAEVGQRDKPHLEEWWDDYTIRDDFQSFLLGYLTSPGAADRPLILLGQPGSGKSVLTKVLSARLPAREFLPVRVVLREVPSDTDLQTQIEYAIRDATGDNLPWLDLSTTAGDALPVVLLDGFDELLQATGVSQSDYLEKIQSFQRREAILGRPVVVLVTSRTAVADRARIPPEGAVALRLEPFSDEQVSQWLDVWNYANASYYAMHDLRPLKVNIANQGTELAREPLLLLMLALYHADGNTVSSSRGDLGLAQLYERLLTSFAEREVRKIRVDLDAEEMHRETERELLRLSVAAFAMCNRNRQWVTEDELNTDLTALLGNSGHIQSPPSGFRARLSPAQVIIGQFFFIHQAQAIRDDTRLTTCEFLHATFGEFLIARLVARELEDLAHTAELAAERTRSGNLDDDFIYSLLSFASLSARATTIDFLAELISAISPARRALLRRLMLGLFHTALDIRQTASQNNYEPVELTGPARAAAYSANLLIIIILVGGEASGADLFPGASDIVAAWRGHATLWRSQLSQDGWAWLANSLNFRRTGTAGNRDILVGPVQDEPLREEIDSYWSWDQEDRGESGSGWSWIRADYETTRRESYLLCDTTQDALVHALDPLAAELLTTIMTFAGFWDDRCVSAAHALIRLATASGLQADTTELTAAYDECIEIALFAFAPFDTETEARYRNIILRQIGHDKSRLPGVWREETRVHLEDIRQNPEAIREHPNSCDLAERIIVKLGFTLR